MKMNNYLKFKIRLKEPDLLNDAEPPDDPLGELTHFELGIRRFCFECNHLVVLEIGAEKLEVFLDPDICMILSSGLPEQISQLSQGKKIQIEFCESICLSLVFQPLKSDRIDCTVKKFGYISEKHFTLKTSDRLCELNQTQVLTEFKQFLEQLMQMAVDGGYITAEENQAFLMPLRELVPTVGIL
jgi:hypothetical protein